MNDNKKIKIGIDLNEILRNRWYQFDRFYYAEFGEDGIPDEPYVYDFFKHYKWVDAKEEEKYLKDELPDDINPLDYVVDKETNMAPVDYVAFKKEEHKLTAKEVFNRFMYQDFNYEIHGSAPVMYKNMELDVEKFFKKYSEQVEFIILSKENWFSISPTLFFLSKILSRFRHYKFVETNEEMWEDVDILITTDPEIISGIIPKNKRLIKIKRPYNDKLKNKGDIKDLLQLNDLNDNKKFEKIIKYKK